MEMSWLWTATLTRRNQSPQLARQYIISAKPCNAIYRRRGPDVIKRTSSGHGTAPLRCRLSDTTRPSFRDQLQAPYIGNVLERIGGNHNQVGELGLLPYIRQT